jgi:hypothetical protein
VDKGGLFLYEHGESIYNFQLRGSRKIQPGVAISGVPRRMKLPRSPDIAALVPAVTAGSSAGRMTWPRSFSACFNNQMSHTNSQLWKNLRKP